MGTNQNINISPGGSGVVQVNSDLKAGTLQISSNTLSSTTTNTNIVLQPNGNGEIELDGIPRIKYKAASCDSTKRGVLMFQEETVSGAGDQLLVCVKKTD